MNLYEFLSSFLFINLNLIFNLLYKIFNLMSNRIQYKKHKRSKDKKKLTYTIDQSYSYYNNNNNNNNYINITNSSMENTFNQSLYNNNINNNNNKSNNSIVNDNNTNYNNNDNKKFLEKEIERDLLLYKQNNNNIYKNNNNNHINIDNNNNNNNLSLNDIIHNNKNKFELEKKDEKFLNKTFYYPGILSENRNLNKKTKNIMNLFSNKFNNYNKIKYKDDLNFENDLNELSYLTKMKLQKMKFLDNNYNNNNYNNQNLNNKINKNNSIENISAILSKHRINHFYNSINKEMLKNEIKNKSFNDNNNNFLTEFNNNNNKFFDNFKTNNKSTKEEEEFEKDINYYENDKDDNIYFSNENILTYNIKDKTSNQNNNENINKENDINEYNNNNKNENFEEYLKEELNKTKENEFKYKQLLDALFFFINNLSKKYSYYNEYFNLSFYMNNKYNLDQLQKSLVELEQIIYQNYNEINNNNNENDINSYEIFLKVYKDNLKKSLEKINEINFEILLENNNNNQQEDNNQFKTNQRLNNCLACKLGYGISKRGNSPSTYNSYQNLNNNNNIYVNKRDSLLFKRDSVVKEPFPEKVPKQMVNNNNIKIYKKNYRRKSNSKERYDENNIRKIWNY